MGQVPPPFYGPPQPRQNNSGVIVAVVVGCFLLVFGFCAFGAYTVFNRSMGMMQHFGTAIAGQLMCDEDFSAARRAVLDYTKKNNGVLPQAAHWQDQVRDYLRKELSGNNTIGQFPFSDPNNPQNAPKPMSPDGDWGCFSNGQNTGMAFNSELSGKKLKDIKDPDTTILLYEIPAPSKNANGPYKEPSTPGITTGSGFRSWKVEYVHEDESQHHQFRTDFSSEDSSDASDSASKGKKPAKSTSDSSSDDSSD